jgi:hypothetical protein
MKSGDIHMNTEYAQEVAFVLDTRATDPTGPGGAGFLVDTVREIFNYLGTAQGVCFLNEMERTNRDPEAVADILIWGQNPDTRSFYID